jgi:hypothetical protein
MVGGRAFRRGGTPSRRDVKGAGSNDTNEEPKERAVGGVPAAVDGSSGYRYYSTGQLHQAVSSKTVAPEEIEAVPASEVEPSDPPTDWSHIRWSEKRKTTSPT